MLGIKFMKIMNLFQGSDTILQNEHLIIPGVERFINISHYPIFLSIYRYNVTLVF